MRHLFTVIVCLGLSASVALQAASDQMADLRREVENLRKEINKRESTGAIGKVESATSRKYGNNLAVETKTGTLRIGGLIQVWYQSVQNDQVGLNNRAVGAEVFENGTAFFDTKEGNDSFDNDTFRIRRTELRFSADITENISGYVMIDPARESNIQYYQLPTLYVRNGTLSNGFYLRTGSGIQGTGSLRNTIVPQLLQDAYINFHGVVPHHDFSVGAFKPPSGEEAWRNSGQLDFVERAMVTGLNNVRDVGVMVHGTFFDDRLQYWAGAFNGPFGTVLSNPELVEGGTRSDDNDAKDFAWRIQGRPVWDMEKWYGRLELGYARTDGLHGEKSSEGGRSFVTNGTNVEETWINRNSAWAWYRPNGPVRGWWFRGEWGSSRDRFYRQGFAVTDTIFNIDGVENRQENPKAVKLGGWYFGTGYKLSDTNFIDALDNGNFMERTLANMEFAFRYEVFDAVVVQSASTPDRNSDVYKTQAWTAGINYYIKGHDAKIQANYIWVDEPNGHGDRGFREIRNNVFVVNFQVMF